MYRVSCLYAVLLSLCMGPSPSVGQKVCLNIPCMNGGTLKFSNSIWGRCRCRCLPGYLGPYCQFEQHPQQQQQQQHQHNRLHAHKQNLKSHIETFYSKIKYLDSIKESDGRPENPSLDGHSKNARHMFIKMSAMLSNLGAKIKSRDQDNREGIDAITEAMFTENTTPLYQERIPLRRSDLSKVNYQTIILNPESSVKWGSD